MDDLAYINCPFCENFFSFNKDKAKSFGGSYLLTCPQCHQMFSAVISVGPLPEYFNKPFTAPVDAPNVVDEFVDRLEAEAREKAEAANTETETQEA